MGFFFNYLRVIEYLDQLKIGLEDRLNNLIKYLLSAVMLIDNVDILRVSLLFVAKTNYRGISFSIALKVTQVLFVVGFLFVYLFVFFMQKYDTICKMGIPVHHFRLHL